MYPYVDNLSSTHVNNEQSNMYKVKVLDLYKSNNSLGIQIYPHFTVLNIFPSLVPAIFSDSLAGSFQEMVTQYLVKHIRFLFLSLQNTLKKKHIKFNEEHMFEYYVTV